MLVCTLACELVCVSVCVLVCVGICVLVCMLMCVYTDVCLCVCWPVCEGRGTRDHKQQEQRLEPFSAQSPAGTSLSGTSPEVRPTSRGSRGWCSWGDLGHAMTKWWPVTTQQAAGVGAPVDSTFRRNFLC